MRREPGVILACQVLTQSLTHWEGMSRVSPGPSCSGLACSVSSSVFVLELKRRKVPGPEVFGSLRETDSGKGGPHGNERENLKATLPKKKKCF